MIPVSEAYKELMQSNVRPQLTPKIKGYINDVEYVWDNKNVVNFTYKREVDPLGRMFPYMELTWTERVEDESKLQHDAWINSYLYMAIELSFEQNLLISPTWGSLRLSQTKWKDLQEITWGTVADYVPKETIKMPLLFISANPSIENNTIKWKATDVMQLLQDKSVFDAQGNIQKIAIANPLVFQLSNAVTPFLFNNPAKNLFLETVENINTFQSENNCLIDRHIIFENEIKKNYANLAGAYGLWWNFNNNGALFLSKDIPDNNIVNYYSSNVLYRNAKVKKNSQISQIIEKEYFVNEYPDRMYTLQPTQTFVYENRTYYTYMFDGYGKVLNYPTDGSAEGDITKAYSRTNNEFQVVPLRWESVDVVIFENQSGEVYEDNNPLNSATILSIHILRRRVLKQRLYNKDTALIEFESLPNLSVEPGDVVQAPVYRNESLQNVLVTYSEIKYNGAIKSTIKGIKLAEVG